MSSQPEGSKFFSDHLQWKNGTKFGFFTVAPPTASQESSVCWGRQALDSREGEARISAPGTRCGTRLRARPALTLARASSASPGARHLPPPPASAGHPHLNPCGSAGPGQAAATGAGLEPQAESLLLNTRWKLQENNLGSGQVLRLNKQSFGKRS